MASFSKKFENRRFILCRNHRHAVITWLESTGIACPCCASYVQSCPNTCVRVYSNLLSKEYI